MTEWRRTLVPSSASILDAIDTLNATWFKIALVVDDDGRLVGSVTDGDIRRAVLRGISLDGPVVHVMNSTPRTARPDEPPDKVIERLHHDQLFHMPIVDDLKRPVGLISRDAPAEEGETHDNWAVIMAGGLGMRLRPLTVDTPKPLLRIGDRPILETIIDSLASQNFRRFYIAVNYRAQQVIDHFGDGSHLDVEIRYLHENEALGTAGALGLIEDRHEAPMLVMNGDLLTNLNFQNLVDYHVDHNCQATVCVREFDIQIPFGVTEVKDDHILAIDEKPVKSFFVNAGIYMVQPEFVRDIEPGVAIDMPQLLDRMLARGDKVAAFPLREFWIDIGQIDDLGRARLEFAEMFGEGK